MSVLVAAVGCIAQERQRETEGYWERKMVVFPIETANEQMDA